MARRKTSKKNVRGKKRTKSTKTYQGRKRFARKRAPMVECKKNTTAVTEFNLTDQSISYWPAVSSFLHMDKGVNQDEFIGDSIFSKYISMKLNFKFPQNEYAIHNRYRVQLIHGWMTAPLAYSATPLNTYVPARGSVTKEELANTITARIDPAFNQVTDRMQFRDKEKTIYKVEGKQWLKTDRDGQIAHPQSTAVLVDGMTAEEYNIGGPPDIFKQLHWKPLRKVRLTRSSNGPEPSNSEFHYPNESWIPFVAVFTPDYGQITNHATPSQPPTENYFPKVEHCDCHWYSDS